MALNAGSAAVECPCIFANVSDLKCAAALCHAHTRMCYVPSVGIFVCSASCREFLTNSSSKKRTVSDQGGNYSQLRGVFDYIEAHRPGLVIFINTDELLINFDSEASVPSNADLICAEWASRGYETQRAVVDSQHFGLPTEGKNQLFINVLTVASPSVSFEDRDVSTVFKTMRSLLKTCALVRLCKRVRPRGRSRCGVPGARSSPVLGRRLGSFAV